MRGVSGDVCIWRVGLVFPPSPVACRLLLELEATQGSNQGFGRRPAGIACVRAPLGLLCVDALGLLPLTLLLLLPCFSAPPLDPVVVFTTSEQLCSRNDYALGQQPDAFSRLCALLGLP